MAKPLVPRELLDPVVAYFKPQRVILFGSKARGEAGRDSDIDLMVVVDDDTPAEKLTLQARYEARNLIAVPPMSSQCAPRLSSGTAASAAARPRDARR